MKSYKHNKNTIKVETDNALIVIQGNLTDLKGRNVTSVRIIPDNYAGENPSVRIGGCSNIRVVTLKHKKKSKNE